MPLPSLDPWRNLTIDEIYHPIFQSYIRCFFTSLFTVTCFIYPFTVYVILTQSTKEMGNYKYFLVYQLSCDFLFDFSAFIYEPIFMWPLPIAYVNSFFPLGPNYLYHFWASSVAIIIAGVHALFISFAYRIGMTFMHDAVKYYFTNKKLLFSSNFLVLAFFLGVFLFPIYKEAHGVPEVQAAFIQDVPILAEVFRYQPNAAGYHPKMMTQWIDVLIIDGVFAMAFIPVAFLCMHFLFISRMKRTEKFLSKSTYKVHRMLYKALTVQLFVSILFLFLPIGAFVAAYVLQLKLGSIYANLCISTAGFDIIFNAFSILYFVKPYNVFIRRKWNRRFSHTISTTATTNSNPKFISFIEPKTAQSNF